MLDAGVGASFPREDGRALGFVLEALLLSEALAPLAEAGAGRAERGAAPPLASRADESQSGH